MGDFPITDHVYSRSLTLPLHEFLSEKDQTKVIKALIEEVFLIHRSFITLG